MKIEITIDCSSIDQALHHLTIVRKKVKDFLDNDGGNDAAHYSKSDSKGQYTIDIELED
jgi:hypothetical protein